MRLIARFAKEKETYFEIITVYDIKIAKERINKITPVLVSIAKEHPAATWFERKIRDDFGIEILYNNDKRPLVKHEHFPSDIFPMRKSFNKLSVTHTEGMLDSLEDEQGLLIGPIHPYHLEASQFQLFEQNNDILHFESMPFYKYRAIEKMVEGLSLEEAKPIIERISGSSSIAYQLNYLDIQLQSSRRLLPKTLKEQHVFFLEFENLINHLYDLAIMCQFVDFVEGYSFFMKLVEEGRETLSIITGHRFGFGAIDLEKYTMEIKEAYGFISVVEDELLWFEKWIQKRTSLWKKLVNRGTLTKEEAINFGLVGLMARSVNLNIDRRVDNKLYRNHCFTIAQEGMGDSSSRFKIRLTEVHSSLKMMRCVIESKVLPFFLGTYQDGEYFSYIESASGELMMYIELVDSKIERFFVRDPSFLNAQALSRCIKNNEMDSLGLILKSIPLSFSANDL